MSFARAGILDHPNPLCVNPFLGGNKWSKIAEYEKDYVEAIGSALDGMNEPQKMLFFSRSLNGVAPAQRFDWLKGEKVLLSYEKPTSAATGSLMYKGHIFRDRHFLRSTRLSSGQLERQPWIEWDQLSKQATYHETGAEEKLFELLEEGSEYVYRGTDRAEYNLYTLLNALMEPSKAGEVSFVELHYLKKIIDKWNLDSKTREALRELYEAFSSAKFSEMNYAQREDLALRSILAVNESGSAGKGYQAIFFSDSRTGAAHWSQKKDGVAIKVPFGSVKDLERRPYFGVETANDGSTYIEAAIFDAKSRLELIRHMSILDDEVAASTKAAINRLAAEGPVGKLTPVSRTIGGTNSTKGSWQVDEEGTHWFLKKDVVHPHLQTSAEVISSAIYRFFGYNAPETVKIVIDGTPYTAVKDLGKSVGFTDFSHINTREIRQMRFIATYLKDWDRLGNHTNNLLLEDGSYGIVDFGGTLGSRAQGVHKKDGEVFSEAIGAFEQNRPSLYGSLQIDTGKLRAGNEHPWLKVNREDALDMVEKFEALNDTVIESIVKMAKYPNDEDALYMIDALKSRRDSLVRDLKTRTFEADKQK